MVSIIVTSQKYNTIPTPLRRLCNVVITFKLSPHDFKTMTDELVYDSFDFNKTGKLVFGEGKHFFIYNIEKELLFSEFKLIKNLNLNYSILLYFLSIFNTNRTFLWNIWVMCHNSKQ